MPKQPFETFTGLAAPLNRANVDTDQIIPKQYLIGTGKNDLEIGLFNDWRYIDGVPGQPDPNFFLNQERYQGVSVLVAGDNFGCGSSREHAPWALMAYGFRCVISTSFADIFYNNSVKNGLLSAVVQPETLEALMTDAQENEGHRITINLEAQTLTSGNRGTYSFSIGEHAKQSLIAGLDDLDATLAHEAQINRFETDLEGRFPWLASP